jgi:hypothetical protein
LTSAPSSDPAPSSIVLQSNIQSAFGNCITMYSDVFGCIRMYCIVLQCIVNPFANGELGKVLANDWNETMR